MKRISKKPEERRQEILNKAQSLFLELGYKKTSVEQIITELNLAKGTFYYYFKSKADLLEALADRHAEAHYASWKEIVDRQELDAIQKLNLVFKNSMNLKLENKQLIVAYLKAMIDDQNIMLRYKMDEKRNQLASDLLGQVVEQGVREGVLDTPYPRESILMVLKLAGAMTDELIPLLLNMFKDSAYIPQVKAKYNTLTFAMERILGAPSCTIRFFDDEALEAFAEIM